MAETGLAEARALVAHLRSARSGREREWRELADWLAPHRGIFSGEDTAPRYQRRNRGAFTQMASQAVLRGASGMTSGMTPRNISWFKPDFSDAEMCEAPGARAWLDVLDTRMKDCLADGGFYQAIQNFNMDLLWAGCALLYCETGEISPLRFECAQIGTFSVSLDENGLVEACEREFMLGAARAAAIFGRENLSEASLGLLKKNPYEGIRITHLARKREDGGGIAGMRYESLFWEEKAEGKFLRKGGYYEMPYFFSRWNDGPTPYGTGPGDDALLDSKQVDLLERRKLEGLGKLINPPVMAPVNYKDMIDLSPGGLNYVQNMELIRTILDLSPYAQAMRWMREELQAVGQRLENELMASIFASMPMEQRPRDMSATEFLERKREALQQIGPVISAYEPNVLTPMLYRVAQTLDRAGLTPPPPEALQGMPLMMKMEFISPMANALRQTGAETTRAIVQDVAAILQATQNAEILDKIDLDQVVDELAQGMGAPGKIIRADAEVAQIRQQRAAMQAQQNQAMEAMQALQMTSQAQDVAMKTQAMNGEQTGQ